MTERKHVRPEGPDPDLAEAERWLARIADGFRPPMELSALPAELIRAEHDRLRRVEAAARALLARCDAADREHAASADLGRPAVRTDEIRRLLAAEMTNEKEPS